MTIAACYLSAEGVVFGADTIKTMKFSHMAPVCGGPVEIAVVTTDRKFRWVRQRIRCGDWRGRSVRCLP